MESLAKMYLKTPSNKWIDYYNTNVDSQLPEPDNNNT